MKILRSLITLIVVIAIGILVYFYVYKAEQVRKEREARERLLVRFDIDNINSFTFSRPDSSIVFERGIGRIWNITEPVEAEAEKEELYTLFRLLNNSRILYNLDEELDNMEMYGLANPEYYMCMKFDVGDPDTLFIGNNTPDGNMAYVHFASENRVLIVSRELTERMKWPVNIFRSRTALNIVKEDITAFEIIRGNDEKIAMVNTGVNWIMQSPWEYNGDNKNIEIFIRTLSESGKRTLVEEKTDDLSRYGLDNPSIVLNVSLRYGLPEKILLIGDRLKEVGATHLYYAKQFDKDLIFTLESSFVDMQTHVKEWYIDKSPMRLNREMVDNITLETGNRIITFMKDAQRNWSVVSPVDKNLEMEIISKIFACSHHISTHDLYAYNPTEEDIIEAGLDKPKAIITMYNNDNMIDQIVFGNTFVLDEPNTYFRTSKKPIIFITRTQVNAELNAVLHAIFGD